MTAQPHPMPADNSTPLYRLEQLRQHISEMDVPDEVRPHLVQPIDDALAVLQRLGTEDPDAVQVVFGGRTADALDDLKDIVEQMLSAIKRSQRWGPLGLTAVGDETAAP